MKKLIFFGIALAILLFSIVSVNIAPAINGLVDATDWMEDSCKFIDDNIALNEDLNAGDDVLKPLKKERDRCKRKQAMVGLEYTAFNVNLIIGFICALLGLLHYLNLGNLNKIPGLIGLGGGAVAFVLTFVYVIESALVFDDIDGQNNIRIDSDGAFLKWDSSKNKYTCIFYEKDNSDSVYLKYSDYGNSYLNYRKDINDLFLNKENNFKYKDFSDDGCNDPSSHLSSSINPFSYCKYLDETSPLTSKLEFSDNTKILGECDYLYHIDRVTDNKKKKIYDHWLTTIILSCFIFLFNIGLAIFGFLLFRESNGSSGSVEIK